MSLITDHDIYLFKEGSHTRLYEKLGCHATPDGAAHFAVWAPNARSVSVIGDFNSWNAGATELHARWDGSGIWEGSARSVPPGSAYKYRIVSHHQSTQEKADPFAFYCEEAPRTASRVWTADYKWGDGEWMKVTAIGDSIR